MSLKENLLHIKNELPAEVTLVAVSKTKPSGMILEAYEAGQRDFGENYVQELADKYQQLPQDIRWHFIGHLQSNKIKYIAPFVYLIHGIDSLKLLRELNKQGLKHKRRINCLLQVYIAREESKFGLDTAEVMDLVKDPAVQQLQGIRICGLMGMASNTSAKGQIRQEFDALSALYKQIGSLNLPEITMQYLSCGMSGDYRIALEAGSNMLRIGSSIFGDRGKPQGP